jgi:hypothetical protein
MGTLPVCVYQLWYGLPGCCKTSKGIPYQAVEAYRYVRC